MAVQFILGRSGTGKTSCCIKAIVNALLEPSDNQPLILLVPEQATYQAQRAILSDERIPGYSGRLNVLSFDRLQFLLLGRNTARPQLSRIGRAMAVQRILRSLSGKLKVFDLSANQPGLGRQIAEVVAELHQYAKTPEDIDELLGKLSSDKLNSLTALKFADISLVFKEYLNFIEAKFIDPDVQLSRARRAIAETNFAKSAKLWVDGFAGFTTGELEILAELLKVVADAQIALCLDPSGIDLENPDSKSTDPLSLFYPTQRTYTELFGIIKKLKLELAEPVILAESARFASCPPLAHIESSIFDHRPAVSLPNPQKKISAGGNVRVIAAPNARMEVRFVAAEILKLVRNKNLRYRDIAVIAPDLARYEHYIRAYFNDYRLPFFIDKRKPLNQHPLIQFIYSALRVVTGSFSSSDIFAYLKTDLVPLERREVDLLENYCVAFGITGSDWQNAKDWHFAEPAQRRFDEQLINQIRQKVSEPLLELHSRLCPADNPTLTAAEFTQTIFDFLDSLGVRERTAQWIEEATEADDHTAADEHRQVYDRLVNIFDELVEVFADEQISFDDLISIIDSAFSQLTLAFIPPTLDQVLVGAIERSRHPDLKAAFLIGATQKQFPAPVAFDGLLTDADRSAAESKDFPLAATTDEKLAERQYLAYIAFTRPAQSLYVTYPLTDNKGSAEVRSQFIINLESLFENLAAESAAAQQTSIEEVHNEYELTDLLCSELGKDAPGGEPVESTRDVTRNSKQQLGRLLTDICVDEQLVKLGSIVQQAVNYDNSAELDKAVTEKFFTGQIRTSATRLSTFAACPYQHFARYILELQERQEFKFEPLDLGIFYHRVLDTFLEQMNLAKMDFAAIQDQKLLELLGKSIAEFVQTDSFVSNFARRSPHNTFIINCASETLEDCVLAIAQIVRAGKFRPTVSEISFGKVEGTRRPVRRSDSEGGTLGEFQLSLSNGQKLFLNGKIDRLDIAKLNGKPVVSTSNPKAALVFDYKRRDKPFSWSQFYYGLDMQLPIYMLAVKNADNTQYKTQDVVGAFYMPVETEIKSTPIDELPEKIDKFYHKAKGIFNGDFFQLLDCTSSNKFYNFYVTKDGSPYGYDNISGALRPADFEKVLRFTQTQIVHLAEEILSGKVDIRPYRLSGNSPCTYCKYKSLCRFDWQINDYNALTPINKLSALEKMGAIDG
jgi:ATP-dependent helicase/nuclease subunit B